MNKIFCDFVSAINYGIINEWAEAYRKERFLKVISFCFEDSSSSIKYAPLVEFNPINLSITK